MRTKAFAMLAVTGLWVASIAYVAPAMAEESSDLPMEQTLADNSSTNTMQPPADNSAQAPSNSSQSDMNSNTGSSSSNGNNSTSNSSTSNDEASPDTATGDDDY